MNVFSTILTFFKNVLGIAPKNIKVARIVNDLPDRYATFWDDQNQEIVVPPGGTFDMVADYAPQLLPGLNEISSKTVRNFKIEGDANICSFAVVNEVGIISALGTNPDDFDIYDKAYTFLSWAKIKHGHQIQIKVVIDEENVVWVVGDLIDDV